MNICKNCGRLLYRISTKDNLYYCETCNREYNHNQVLHDYSHPSKLKRVLKLAGISIGMVLTFVFVAGFAIGYLGSPSHQQTNLSDNSNVQSENAKVESLKQPQTDTSKSISTTVIPKITLPEKQPIAVYHNCGIGTHFAGDQDMNIICDGMKEHLRFLTPEKLINFQIWNGNGPYSFSKDYTLYKYGDNDFELGIKDQVSEKKYTLKLWEMP